MYHLYPTLLNSYNLFKQKIARSDGSLVVSYEDLLAQINREERPTTVAQQSGINFENAVITGKGEGAFKENVLEGIREKLPNKYKTQVFNKFQFGKVELYGYVDVMGEGRAIDIKTTKKYTPGQYAGNFQNLYLLGLKSKGVSQLDYLITDFEQVYVESYHIRQYNFTPMLEMLEDFTKFLELNRSMIRNEKIFGVDKQAKPLPLFPNL